MAGSNKSLTSSPAAAPGQPPKVVRFYEGDRKTENFSEKLRIKYSICNRLFSLVLTQSGIMDHVLSVDINIKETAQGMGSATLSVEALVDQANGATCEMTNEFNGTAVVKKNKFSFRSMPDTEFLFYNFPDPKSGSCFILEKNCSKGFMESITVAHCFSISEREVYYVAIKIASNRGAGLSVEMEGPVKRTNDFILQLHNKFTGIEERKARQVLLGGLFRSSAAEDVNLFQSANEDFKLVQSAGSYVNTGTQSYKGLVNSSGNIGGFGNASCFYNCRISPNK